MLHVIISFQHRNHDGKWLLILENEYALQMSYTGDFYQCPPSDAVCYSAAEVDKMIEEFMFSKFSDYGKNFVIVQASPK